MINIAAVNIRKKKRPIALACGVNMWRIARYWAAHYFAPIINHNGKEWVGTIPTLIRRYKKITDVVIEYVGYLGGSSTTRFKDKTEIVTIISQIGSK